MEDFNLKLLFHPSLDCLLIPRGQLRVYTISDRHRSVCNLQ